MLSLNVYLLTIRTHVFFPVLFHQFRMYYFTAVALCEELGTRNVQLCSFLHFHYSTGETGDYCNDDDNHNNNNNNKSSNNNNNYY